MAEAHGIMPSTTAEDDEEMCELCGEEFPSVAAMMAHIEAEHSAGCGSDEGDGSPELTFDIPMEGAGDDAGKFSVEGSKEAAIFFDIPMEQHGGSSSRGSSMSGTARPLSILFEANEPGGFWDDEREKALEDAPPDVQLRAGGKKQVRPISTMSTASALSVADFPPFPAEFPSYSDRDSPPLSDGAPRSASPAGTNSDDGAQGGQSALKQEMLQRTVEALANKKSSQERSVISAKRVV